MSKTLEFFFDVGSPTAYLAWTQLPGICQRSHASLVYQPMLLGGVFQATGNSAPGNVEAKGRYMKLDIERFATRYQVPFHFNPDFPINTLFMMRALTGVKLHAPERFEALLSALFHRMWVDPVNLNLPDITAKVMDEVGFAPEQMLAFSADNEVKGGLRATTEEAVRRGAFGAPTIFIGEDMFFGQDRLDFVEQALKD